MTNTKAKLNDIVATAANDLEFLGRIVWFSLGSLLVPRADLELKFDELGIPEDYLPSARSGSPPFCFKRAVRVAQRRKTLPNGNVHVWMVRDLGDRERRLVRELQDIDGNRLDYLETGTWVLEGNGKSHRMKRDPCAADCIEHGPYVLTSRALANNGEEKLFRELDKEVRDEYDLQLTGIVDRQIRSLIDEAKLRWQAIPMRPTGGVEFVPEDHAHLVDKFSELFEWLNQYCRTDTTIELTAIPVVNDGDRRAMVEKKYETAAAGELYELIEDVKAVLEQDEEPSDKVVKKLNERYEKAVEVKDHYEYLLATKMGKTNAALRLCQNQLKRIHGRDIDELMI